MASACAAINLSSPIPLPAVHPHLRKGPNKLRITLNYVLGPCLGAGRGMAGDGIGICDMLSLPLATAASKNWFN